MKSGPSSRDDDLPKHKHWGLLLLNWLYTLTTSPVRRHRRNEADVYVGPMKHACGLTRSMPNVTWPCIENHLRRDDLTFATKAKY